jgi:hypothetical protein
MPDPADGPPPSDVTDELSAVSKALDRVIPAKTATNLLIGTWNVRAFDRINTKWRSANGDSPIRDRSNVLCIAEVVSRFDVVAIQEVRRSANAFLAMMQALGEGWAFLVTDVTEGDAGNNERLAFVFDARRLAPPDWPANSSLPPSTPKPRSSPSTRSSHAPPTRSASRGAAHDSPSSPCTSSTATPPPTASLNSPRSHNGWPAGQQAKIPGERT